MSAVVRRTFRSTPYRQASETWTAIVDLLTAGRAGPARIELLSISGIAASTIADHAPKGAPIVVTCEGPRTRIYCVYDEDALEDGAGNETALGYDALKGDWRISLPCHADDLSWVSGALKAASSRITARDLASKDVDAKEENTAAAASQGFVIDPKGFSEP